MKKGTFLGICLLSLFALSVGVPIFLVNAELNSTTIIIPEIYPKKISDLNNDKIDDALYSQLNELNGFSDEIAVKFNHRISNIDRLRLINLGAICFDEIWDEGSRIKIASSLINLKKIAELTDIELITSAEVRQIMVAIDGTDYSELSKLEQFENSEIFWYVGCALVPHYSGFENDLRNIGSFSVIQDTTDIYHTFDAIPGDEEYAISTLTNAATINVTNMKDSGYTGSGVKICIVDTGVNGAHPDLSGRVTKQESFVLTTYGYDYDDTTNDDNNGHGTHCAGIAAGDGTGNSAYEGIAPDAQIYAAKIGDWTESTAPATSTSMVAAINWAVAQGADVINLSYGTGYNLGKNIIENAINNAVKSGVTFCTSAGNNGDEGIYNADSPDHAISVGIIDDGVNPPDIIYYSAKGPTTEDHMKPDLMAPGYQIAATSYSGSGYLVYSGTSMASPQIAGASAVLLQAFRSNAIDDSPGTVKAALMNTADLITPVSSNDLLIQGRGIANVGAAFTLALNSPKEGNKPLIGAINPVVNPISIHQELYQGQTVDTFITCVSPFTTDLSVEVTGDAASFVNVSTLTSHQTAIQKLTYSIPADTLPTTYNGEIQFFYDETNLLDTADIDLTVLKSHGEHRMMLNFRTTNWPQDHMYGQYREFSEDILENGWVISEQNTFITPALLEDYEAVWFPDPFSIYFPNGESGDFSTRLTWGKLTAAEMTALRDFVDNGGTVFFDFLGTAYDATEDVYYGNNVTHINEFTEDYGIHVRDDVWTNPNTVAVNVVGSHALTAGVEAIDHYGCSLELSGDAVQVTEFAAGSEYATCAYYQDDSGGRVIVLSTNFGLDNDGYLNKYNLGVTQNDVFGRNLVRWATSSHKIEQVNYTYVNGVVNMTYEYINGPGADFGGYVITPSNTRANLTWTDMGNNLWSFAYECTELGIHHFYPECGETGVDEFDYLMLDATVTVKGGIAPIITVLVGFLGLSSWYFLSKKKKR